GDVMASQKLSFLQKIDPKHAADAIARKRGQAGAAQAPVAVAAASAPPANDTAPAGASPTAPSIFESLDARLKKNPSLAKEIGVIVQFDVEKPSGAWTVDLTGEGSVRAGGNPKATTTLRIADADLAALSKAADLQETARSLYQHGKLRVDGDMRPAHKLMLLKDAV
ncbi:MAG: SCP2 sterol-binding domain-containing protein, partial [Polyangiaceae bacterium]